MSIQMRTEEEIKQFAEQYQEKIKLINAMSDEDLEDMIKADDCPYPTELLVGVPLGMFHCPLCGEMVLAAFPHTRARDDVEPTSEELLGNKPVGSNEGAGDGQQGTQQ